MTNFIDEFRLDFLDPLARTFFGNEFLGQSGLDSHRAFIVSYKISKDVELDYHYDNAEITLNVCLGDVFHDGDLYFGAMAKANRRTFANFTCNSFVCSLDQRATLSRFNQTECEQRKELNNSCREECSL